MNVSFLVMADFVGKNCDKFVGCVLVDEGVKKNDTFEWPKTSEVSIGFGGAT